MKTYFPYGPGIGHAKLPDELVNDLNKDCDDIVKNKELSKSRDWSRSLVGEVEQELLISKDVVNKWGSWFGLQVRAYVAAYFNQLTIPNQNIFSVPMKEAQQAAFFENDRIGFVPKVGNWYLFPASIRHAVYPFKADGERRSFSINMSTNMFKPPSEK